MAFSWILRSDSTKDHGKGRGTVQPDAFPFTFLWYTMHEILSSLPCAKPVNNFMCRKTVMHNEIVLSNLFVDKVLISQHIKGHMSREKVSDH